MEKQYKYNRHEQLRKDIRRRERRKIRARGEKEESIWFGLGTFGIIGWSVAIPTIIGVAIGIWLDRKWPGTISWTVTLLIVGVALGCYNAWYWITKNRKYIEEQKNKDKDE
jgi:ATP synthase protein I